MKWAIVIASTLSLAACGGIGTPQTLDQELASAAREINRIGQGFFDGEFPMVDVMSRVDGGDTLVLRIENFPSGTQTYDVNAMRKILRPKVCEPRVTRSIVEKGGKVRVEFQSNFGKELPAIQIASC